jgi:hypothetical protein
VAYEIYGLVELQVQSYLIIVTKAEFSANIADRHVYVATEFLFVPLGFQDPAEDKVGSAHQAYIDMFQKIFTTNSLYFSPQYDLTRPFAVLAANAFKSRSFDERFFYNSVYVQKFRDNGLEHLIQPFVSGLVEQRVMNINQKAINFIIVSRRDKTRAGFRFVSRGTDSMGNVSNFAETEQIISFMNEDHFDVYTYLQTRGSIPIVWKQTPNMSWSPKVLIEQNSMRMKSVFENHLNKMKNTYKANHLINLIDKKGSQKKIGDTFSELVRLFQDPKIKYTWFDFHAECAKMQWHNLSKLITQVQASIQDYKYGHYKVFKRVVRGDQTEDEAETKVYTHQVQEGVFRTNCMDCLDRTNVVQSVIARNILLSQLYSVAASDSGRHHPAAERRPVRRAAERARGSLPRVLDGQRGQDEPAVHGHRRAQDGLHEVRQALARRLDRGRQARHRALLPEHLLRQPQPERPGPDLGEDPADRPAAPVEGDPDVDARDRLRRTLS